MQEEKRNLLRPPSVPFFHTKYFFTTRFNSDNKKADLIEERFNIASLRRNRETGLLVNIFRKILNNKRFGLSKGVNVVYSVQKMWKYWRKPNERPQRW